MAPKQVLYELRNLRDLLVGREYGRGYDGFVELSHAMVKGRDARGQQLAVLSVLRSLMPDLAAERFRRWFPLSQARWPADGRPLAPSTAMNKRVHTMFTSTEGVLCCQAHLDA
jgi:hypothetical protein